MSILMVVVLRAVGAKETEYISRLHAKVRLSTAVNEPYFFVRPVALIIGLSPGNLSL